MDIILFRPVLPFAVVVHAHGSVALRQGDDTANLLGRLTLIPIRLPPLDGSHVLYHPLPPIGLWV